MLWRARAAVATIENVLAGVERRPVDQPLVPPLEDLPVAMQFADVEAIVENVRKSRAVETRLAGAVDVPLAFQAVGQALERVTARGVQLEDANNRLRLLRMRLNRLVRGRPR